MKTDMIKSTLIALALTPAWFLTTCNVPEHQTSAVVPNALRAPAYPLVTVDPYFSGWSTSDRLYDDAVRHWTEEKRPLTGAIRVDGRVYRFMGIEEPPLVTLAPMASEAGWTARYTRQAPARGWHEPGFDDSGWSEGAAAFGSEGETAVCTVWDGDGTEIFVRREITLDEIDDGWKILLIYSHDDDFTLYINGRETVNTGYRWNKDVLIILEGEARQSLRVGRNVIAAHGKNMTGGALVDFGLYAEKTSEQYFETTAEQLSADVQATQTRYRFACGTVDLQLTFTAPLLMHDLDLLSRPVNYISYSVTPNDGQAHEVEIYFDAAPAWALDKAEQESASETFEKDGLLFLKTGSTAQEILGKRGDNVRIDWGYFYLCAEADRTEAAAGNAAAMHARFKNEGAVGNAAPGADGDSRLALSRSLGKINGTVEGKIMVGYDDIYAIQYFGENLRPYWNRDGKRSIEAVLHQACADYAELKAACDRFDLELMTKAADAGGKEYAELCALAYRQSISAHKLVEAPNGELLFLSKENFSNGSIGTVDVTYPSAPLYLLYNTELAKGLLNHIFYYSESGRWTKPFAAHDVGTYPQANGQTYGGDMPVEESGNMLILTAAIAVREGNADYAAQHWPTLAVWADYLAEKGLDPENQLCTDDFAGHFAHNANLSVKAILGIASCGYLAERLGKKEEAEKYASLARTMAAKWIEMADDGDHFRLTFDQPGTWSQKYNLVWDKLLRLGIFPPTVAQKEIAYYLTKQDVYGLPLDNRQTYTKSDWVVWTATLATDRETFERFIRPVHLFMHETTDRVPMSDWYFTDIPMHAGFQARSVVGGYFIKMLEAELDRQRQ
ncbi:MAG: DUF4965 domain-containing protein [Tannerella sp.]|jgi:hypothetical protein|nr:DUF4965 domain-containing protein [Tannerella sp.]